MQTVDERQASPGWLRRAIIGRNPRRTLVRAALLALSCFLISQYVLRPVRVDGISMLPTYRDNGVNFVNRLAYFFHEPQRGDVVGIRLAGEHAMYMKRIVALPGETVAFREGRLWINGQPLEEPYVKLPCDWAQPPQQVGSGEYYVVGDNRSMDFWGHVQGRALRKRIIGKVLL